MSRMKKLIYILFTILLLGCSVAEPSCQNITIEHNNTVEVIREVNISSPCEPITIEKNISIPDITCQKERIKLITQLDYTRDILDDCMESNSTSNLEGLQQNYSNCLHDKSDLNTTYIHKINDLNNTVIRLRNRLNESNVTE